VLRDKKLMQVNVPMTLITGHQESQIVIWAGAVFQGIHILR
jgi:hypothetical protein